MDEGLRFRSSSRKVANDEADRALLRRIGHGDRLALRTLYASYHQPLLRFIFRITHRLDLAEEGVNDVMLVVWRNSDSFAHRSNVSTWIMGIGYRKALKLLASSRRWHERFAAVDFTEWIERSEPTGEPSDDGDLRNLLDEALRHLSIEHRAVVELTYFYGCSYDEIAEIVDCPVNTVKTRMFHARAKLKALMPRLGQVLP